MAAHYALTGDHDGVHEGHVLNIGRPWLPGSECDHLYMSTPYLRPPEFRVHAAPTRQRTPAVGGTRHRRPSPALAGWSKVRKRSSN